MLFFRYPSHYFAFATPFQNEFSDFLPRFQGNVLCIQGNRRPQISFAGSLEDGSVRRDLSWSGTGYICGPNNRFATLSGLGPVEHQSETLSMKSFQ